MSKVEYQFSRNKVNCLFGEPFDETTMGVQKDEAIIITDRNVYEFHKNKMEGFRVIQVEPGEIYKTQSTIDHIIGQLLEMEADKHTMIIGVGGGVVTDIAGFVASIYKRGTRLGLVPTTILGMVDASIGGKNGIDVGVFKNMVGTILQPEFILFDYDFLQTLPIHEWINGFAEVIKHASIMDPLLFSMLERYSLHEIQADSTLVASLVEQNAEIKMKIVTGDEFERADRRLLNFGHTLGHAIENFYQLPHGQAVSIGMVAACNLSEKLNGFHYEEAKRVVKLLSRYHLPVDLEIDHVKVFEILKKDKKRSGDQIQFVLLNAIGKAVVMTVPVKFIQDNLQNIL